MLDIFNTSTPCTCGRIHPKINVDLIVCRGAISSLPKKLSDLKTSRAFILCDENTHRVAGGKVEALLKESSIPYSLHILKGEVIEPDEKNTEIALSAIDTSVDTVISVGSGVIGDIAKIVAKERGASLLAVATAPSMDGYASATSSMIQRGLKVTVSSKCPDVIIGDTDILKTAPDKMLISGLGDMLAKYISIAEWRISNIVNGEYYCEKTASIVREALRRCVENKDGLLKREDAAIEAVFFGLVLCGISMTYAGASRPASGGEHYISHIFDMRALEFGTPSSTHGIQCAIGTLKTAELYERLKSITPCKEKAIAYAEAFDKEQHFEFLRSFLGRSAEAMISLETRENKYSIRKHRERIDRIIDRWDDILKAVNEEIPSSESIRRLLSDIGCPTSLPEIGLDEDILPPAFRATRDIRDKYVLSRLAFDLGEDLFE